MTMLSRGSTGMGTIDLFEPKLDDKNERAFAFDIAASDGCADEDEDEEDEEGAGRKASAAADPDWDWSRLFFACCISSSFCFFFFAPA